MTPFLVKIHNVQGWIVPPIVLLKAGVLSIFIILLFVYTSCKHLLYVVYVYLH